jgi:phosphopantothenoylcysteine synthetase/decarboxylase
MYSKSSGESMRHDYQTNPKESDRFFHVPRKFTDRWFDEIEVNAKWTLNNKNLTIEQYITKNQIRRAEDANNKISSKAAGGGKQYHMDDFFERTSKELLLSDETLDEVAEQDKSNKQQEDEEDENDEELFFILKNHHDGHEEVDEDEFDGDVILDEIDEEGN